MLMIRTFLWWVLIRLVYLGDKEVSMIFWGNAFPNSISSSFFSFSTEWAWAKLVLSDDVWEKNALSSSLVFLTNFAGAPAQTCE